MTNYLPNELNTTKYNHLNHNLTLNKYYNLEIRSEGFSYQRKLELIAQETALDGVYVLRTSLESTLMDAATTVKAYKSLSRGAPCRVPGIRRTQRTHSEGTFG